MKPLVSIIVNCRNGAEYLDKCLKSIKEQEFKNWELIFFNNQSTDNSKDIFENNICGQFNYFQSDRHLSLYEARNAACKYAQGRYIAFLDTDDVWYKNYLSSRVDFFDDENKKFSYCNCHHFYEKSNKKEIFTKIKLKSGFIFDFLANNYLVKISCLIIEKNALKNVGYFNPNYNIIGDYDVVMKLAQFYEAHAVQEPLVEMRFHNKNFLDLNRSMFFKEYKNWYYSQNFENKILKNHKNKFLRYLIYLFLISVVPSIIKDFFKKK